MDLSPCLFILLLIEMCFITGYFLYNEEKLCMLKKAERQQHPVNNVA